MPDRENILHKVRTALGRRGGQAPRPAPPPRLDFPSWDREERVRVLLENFPGHKFRAGSPDEAREFIASKIAGGSAVAANDPLLGNLGIPSLPGVHSLPADEEAMRRLCAACETGIGGADYALADPGALVLLSTSREGRLVSLAPPHHIAVISAECILTGLDELFTVLSDPASVSSSMVLIGGPSRTGDIEMILTLGVHGPREVSLVIV